MCSSPARCRACRPADFPADPRPSRQPRSVTVTDPQPLRLPSPREVTRGEASRYAVQGTLALDLRGSQPGLPDTPELETAHQPRVPCVSDAEVRSWAARLAQ